MKKDRIPWRWVEGQVDPLSEHIELSYGDAVKSDYASWRPLVLVGRPKNNTFPVTWIATPETPDELSMIAAARKELDFYLVEVGGENPWAYACYHCTTGANMYSQIHWSYFPHGHRGDRRSSAVVRLRTDKGDGLFIVKPGFIGSKEDK
jgi:hypothetical protein